MGSAAVAEPAATSANQPAKEQPTDVSEAVVSPEPKDEDPTICRREKPTGSSIGVKVCMKKSQWVAKSSRRRGSGEIRTVDGIDDTLAPLPSSN